MNCKKLNGCETGKCKVTLGHKLPAESEFHTVRPRDRNEQNWMIVIKVVYRRFLVII